MSGSHVCSCTYMHMAVHLIDVLDGTGVSQKLSISLILVLELELFYDREFKFGWGFGSSSRAEIQPLPSHPRKAPERA